MIKLASRIVAALLCAMILRVDAFSTNKNIGAPRTRPVGVDTSRRRVMAQSFGLSRCNLLLDPAIIVDTSTVTSNSLMMAETEAWVQPTATLLGPFLNIMSFFMLTRVVLSWYPTTNVKEIPWILVVLPTEPLLRSVRGVIPAAFGVDITPIFWLAVFTFINEILLGQQGLLTLKMKYGI